MLWKYLILFSIFLLRQETQGRPSTKLQKITISNPEAVCNDNSRAVFYIGVHSRKKWILFFESGGLCYSRENCNERYLNRNSTVLMTSKVLPGEVTGKDLLSPLERENPMFHSYTHVLVPYCSSDLWLGSRTGPQRKSFSFVDDPSVDNFSFRGHTIFQSVFSELRKEFNLNDAEEIILSGSSAGAIGVLNHAKWVLDDVILSHGWKAKLLLILDSSWFIDFQDSIKSRVKPEFAKMANISSKACADISYGYSCCLSSSCMLERGYFPTNVPAMFVFSLYDIYMFAEVLKRLEDQGKTAEYHSADFLSVVSMYGGAMNESIMLLSQSHARNMSYFVAACFQHTYFSTSSLWDNDGILRPLVEVTRGTGKFSHRIQSGIWTSTRIKNSTTDMSLREFLSAWVQSGFTRAAMIDSCIGAHCNPTCPDKLVFTDSGIVWVNTVKGIVIALSLVITIVCLGLKSSFTFYYSYLAWKRKQYFNDSETFQARKELPLTRTDEAISIACLSLTYLVDIKKRKPREETDEDSKEDRNSRRSVVLRGSIIGEEDTGSVDQEFDEDGEMNLLGSKAANENSNLKIAERTLEEQSSQRQHSDSFGSYDVNSTRGSNAESHQALMPDSKDSGLLSCVSPKLKHGESVEKKSSRLKKQILKGVSAYFNTGELVAIMGPSGCGKTTFLDLLTGRRRDGDCKGQVYINGVGLGEIQDWYACKIGYVLQLALPYYEELTVRENLFFAAHMRLPKETRVSEKFERVEQIIAETGLTSVAEIVVGGSNGLGLSGGQKRRLCVALQMINMPSVLFLDEPTSGLDATSSLELLNHLNLVAESGRLVILTIHQPRLEIFHLFHKILFLCDGQVAYYGEPSMAPEIFLKAYAEATTEEFRLSDEAPKIDAKNPADTIMDLLNCSQARRAILDYYQTSGEPQAVQEAINTAQKNASETTTTSRMAKIDGDAGSFNRIFVLESRAAERQTLGQILYFPVIFCMFGIIIGTVYWRAEERDGILLMSAYCVYCCASPLFLSSVLMTHLNKALDIFHLEREDGCGRSYENVIETFVRTVAVCVLPVIVCSTMSYFMVMTTYDLWKFSFVTVISLVLNQTWIAVYMMVICAEPRVAHRICPMVSAIGGFAGGFLVPRPQMPIVYNLLFYINPQFYGYSAITKVLLLNVRLKCEYESTLNCISTDGNAVLSRFGFEKVNPYEHLVIMLAMTISSLLLAWLFLEMKYFNFRAFRKRSPVFSEAEGPTDVKVAIEPIDKVPAKKAEEELSEEIPEIPLDFVSPFSRNRRSAKSRLGLISIDQGFHTVKLPAQRKRSVPMDNTFRTSFEEAGGEVEDAAQFRPRCKTSALQRDLWMSTRRRMVERKITLDMRMTQVQHLARRFSIYQSQSVRRRAREKASIPRRSTMGTAVVADVNREQFAKKRNISRPHDGILDRFNQETETSPYKGEETNAVNSERLTEGKRVSFNEEFNLTTREGNCFRNKERDDREGCTMADSIELVDKEDSSVPSQLRGRNIPKESTALSSDLEHGTHLKMESPSTQRTDQMERTNHEPIKTILKQGNDRRSNSSSQESLSSQAEKQAEKNEKSKKKVSIALSEFTDILDI